MMSDDVAWFEANRTFVSRQYPGMWVVVKNQAIIGAYPTQASAYQAGVAMFGTEKFFIGEATQQARVEWLPGRVISGPRRRVLGQQVPMDLAERLRQRGALLQVQIGVPAALAQQMQAEGKTVPPPQITMGMVDTGASISTVSDKIAAAAGLQSVGSVPLGGVGGMSDRPIMAASIGLPEYNVAVDPIEIAAVTIPAPGFEVLIGRDMLKALHLDYRGPEGAFTLESGPAGGEVGVKPTTGTWIAIGGGLVAVAVGALFALDVL